MKVQGGYALWVQTTLQSFPLGLSLDRKCGSRASAMTTARSHTVARPTPANRSVLCAAQELWVSCGTLSRHSTSLHQETSTLFEKASHEVVTLPHFLPHCVYAGEWTKDLGQDRQMLNYWTVSLALPTHVTSTAPSYHFKALMQINKAELKDL